MRRLRGAAAQCGASAAASAAAAPVPRKRLRPSVMACLCLYRGTGRRLVVARPPVLPMSVMARARRLAYLTCHPCSCRPWTCRLSTCHPSTSRPSTFRPWPCRPWTCHPSDMPSWTSHLGHAVLHAPSCPWRPDMPLFCMPSLLMRHRRRHARPRRRPGAGQENAAVVRVFMMISFNGDECGRKERDPPSCRRTSCSPGPPSSRPGRCW